MSKHSARQQLNSIPTQRAESLVHDGITFHTARLREYCKRKRLEDDGLHDKSVPRIGDLNAKIAAHQNALTELNIIVLQLQNRVTGGAVALQLLSYPDDVLRRLLANLTRPSAVEELRRLLRVCSLEQPPTPRADTYGSAGATDNGAAESEPYVPPRARKAYEQFRKAAAALELEEPTDREAYDCLCKAHEKAKDQSKRVFDGDNPPSFATWSRNIREYRRRAGTQKQTRRAGRTAGSRQFATIEDIEPQTLPASVRPREYD